MFFIAAQAEWKRDPQEGKRTQMPWIVQNSHKLILGCNWKALPDVYLISAYAVKNNDWKMTGAVLVKPVPLPLGEMI
jgi:hypothetical protein